MILGVVAVNMETELQPQKITARHSHSRDGARPWSKTQPQRLNVHRGQGLILDLQSVGHAAAGPSDTAALHFGYGFAALRSFEATQLLDLA